MYQFIHDGYENDKIDYYLSVGTDFLMTFWKESKIKTVGFYDIHSLAKIHKLPGLPKIADIMENLRKSGFKVERTHMTPTGIKTDAKMKDILKILKKLIS